MSLKVIPINHSKKELTEYVKFGIDLYKGNDYFVPPLIFDDVATLDPSKNPAFEFCEAQAFMAYRDGKPVGRITARRPGARRHGLDLSIISTIPG